MTDERLQDVISSHGVAYRAVDNERRLAVTISFWDGLSQSHEYEVRQQLPREVHGFPVVVEQDPNPQPCWFRTPRPRAGVAIRVKDSTRQGTLSCFVERAGQIFALTCEHVLGEASQVGTTVEWLHSSFRQSIWVELGTVAELGGLKYDGGDSPTDSALILVTSGYRSRACRISRPSLAPLDPYEAVAMETAVHKIGARTGYTTGRITGLFNISVRQRGPDDPTVEPRVVRHQDVLEIRSDDPRGWLLCDNGDSGAVFWERERNPRAVGLLIATSFGYKGFAIPMKKVLDYHNGATLIRGG